MVLDILAAIGLKEAGSFLAKDVLLPLLQGSLEDYAKDFFKGSIADAAGLASQEPVQKALGMALKAFIGKQYVREVKGILRSSPDLRELLALHNQEAMRRGIDELVGIPPDFDLRKYQETLREQYRRG